jgi:flavin reductase (DIM6/NTAB) family NADH-FMN oxidoreductase RutF
MDSAQFRQLLGRFATGVTVVTTRMADGHPGGMTASSLASVSLDPPLLSACIAHTAELYEALMIAPGFVVNILSESQEAVARQFAASDLDRFEGVGHRASPGGYPILDGVIAWMECAPHAAFPGGDHTILVGRLLHGGTSDGAPLAYYRGGFTGLGRG